jgi:hypothetical protein
MAEVSVKQLVYRPVSAWRFFAWMNVAWFLDDLATAAADHWSWFPTITQHTFGSAFNCAFVAAVAFLRALDREGAA